MAGSPGTGHLPPLVSLTPGSFLHTGQAPLSLFHTPLSPSSLRPGVIKDLSPYQPRYCFFPQVSLHLLTHKVSPLNCL